VVVPRQKRRPHDCPGGPVAPGQVQPAGGRGSDPAPGATHLLQDAGERGESLARVALLAGHASLDTTARYTRPGAGDLERAVEKLAWE